jgi:hypothetical protein
LGKAGLAVGCSEVLAGWVRKSGKVAGYDWVGKSPIKKRSGKVIQPGKTV